MRLLLNGINGEYPRLIVDNSVRATEVVEAAVAYAKSEYLLFEWCWENSIPLRFWGRFDDGIPVDVRILKKFLERRSANFTCKLVRQLHAKVIWWHGVGAYIGSANLTEAAWYNNVEAGCFFDQPELEQRGIDLQLRSFFRRIDANSSPLNDEIYRAIDSRAKDLQRIAENDRASRQGFLLNTPVRQWDGLVRENARTADQRQKNEFSGEWYGTLQILRDIGSKVSSDQYRPRWIPADVPIGAQADQFLHAHYYNHVIDEQRRSIYEAEFERNQNDPEGALRRMMEWWKGQTSPPSGEDKMLLEWRPFLQRALSRDRILELTLEEFTDVCRRVWSIQDHARRVSNKTLGLPQGHYTMESKTTSLAKFLFARRSQNGSTVLQVIHHILYGGGEADIVDRLWDGIASESWKIEHMGVSALGELVGWGIPDRFPPRNNRTSKSLRSLGFPVAVHD